MILVDTGAWFALEDPDDSDHPEAVRFRAKIAQGRYGAMVTTDYVLDETATLLVHRAGATVAAAFLEKIRTSPSTRILWVTDDLFWKASELLRARPDKRWSFTDCTSFVAMEAMGIRTAFGFDHNFSQAGYDLLPTVE